MAFWLFKSEPDVFSFDDLLRAPKRTTFWEGVRNYQARNFLRDQVKKGDGVLYYHSGGVPRRTRPTAAEPRKTVPQALAEGGVPRRTRPTAAEPRKTVPQALAELVPMAVVGTARVVREGHPDPTQFDRKSKYYDEGSSSDEPRWFGVDIAADKPFTTPVTLKTIKESPELAGMMLVKKGARLSIQPVTDAQWRRIVAMGGIK